MARQPVVGGDTNAWGTVLNEYLDSLVTSIAAAQATGTAALPKSGGTLTGHVTVKDASLTRVDKGNISGAVDFDLSLGDYFTATVTGAITALTLSNVPTGAVATGVIVRFTNLGAFAVAWPSLVKWPGGVVPTFTVSGVDVVVFITDDGGTTVRGSVLAKDSR